MEQQLSHQRGFADEDFAKVAINFGLAVKIDFKIKAEPEDKSCVTPSENWGYIEENDKQFPTIGSRKR